jgi:hypothetical protein
MLYYIIYIYFIYLNIHLLYLCIYIYVQCLGFFLTLTFNGEDEEHSIGKMKKNIEESKFPPSRNFTFNSEDEEESKFSSPSNFTFSWEDEEGSSSSGQSTGTCSMYIYISLHMWHMCSIVDWALMLDPMTKQVENMDSALHPLNVWPINVFSHWKTEYLNHLTVNSSSFIITKPLTQEPMISPWCFLSLEASGGWSLCWADQHCHPVGLWPSASKLRKQKQLGFYWISWRFQA